MAKNWEDMTADEKADVLRNDLNGLRGQLRLFASELENGQRTLNDRIVRLEQALERFERLQPVRD